MAHHSGTHPQLTNNEFLVMETLSNSNGALSAYTILDQLRESGFRAPRQVYRALDKLLEYGMVHRIESKNAFIACQCPDDKSHTRVAFTICESCGDVSEIFDNAFDKHLEDLANINGFVPRKSTVELSGFCSTCG